MENRAKAVINRNFIIGEVSGLIYGQYFEPLGRCLHEGMFDPDHPASDDKGFRRDIRELVEEMGITCFRYPGGNLTATYRWEDGVGPVEQRPVRLELAWRSIEDNSLGTCEAAEWVESCGAESIMTFNMGTRGVEAACDLVEYCNTQGGTYLSELRKKHGYEKPFNIKYWCLGNELDGEWQICQKRSSDYAWLCRETAKAVKRIDPGLQLIAAGSSGMYMDTYPAWDMEVLETAYNYIDGISIHAYVNRKRSDTTLHYLAQTAPLDNYISTIESACKVAKAKKRGKKDIFISIDEWNVQSYEMVCLKEDYISNWDVHPPILEQVYTMEDALALGLELIVFLKHCRSVKIACMSLLVNALAPIMTAKGGPAWRQTTFYPFSHCAKYGRGVVMDTKLECDTYVDEEFGTIPYIECAAVFNQEVEELTVFAVNKNEEEACSFECEIEGFEGYEVIEHIAMSNDHLFAVNSEKAPDTVKPRIVNNSELKGKLLVSQLEKLSWNVIRMRKV